MMIVTLAEAKDHIEVDFDDKDAAITLYVKAASQAVVNYLKDAADVFLDEDNEVDDEFVTFEVKAATLLMVGYLYKNRDNNEGDEFKPGYLPAPVTALLYPLRDPGYA
jgi:hypothetical protein